MADTGAERRLSAIMAADVVGYSRLVEVDEGATLASLKELRQSVLDALLAAHRGRLVKLMGDGLSAEFGLVVCAVACAAAIQARLAESQGVISPERRIVLRIGINLDDVVVEGDDLLGEGVNVAARLEQLCPPGGVMISGTTYDHLQGKLDCHSEFAGEDYWEVGYAQYTACQHEAAVETLRQETTYRTGSRRILAAGLAQLGWEDEAGREAELFMVSNPHFTISYWAATQPFRDQMIREHFVDGYRKAGLRV